MPNNYTLYKKAWVYQGAEYQEQRLDKKEIRALLQEGGLMVRNVFDFDCNEETMFWYIIKDKFDGMEELSSKTRNQVRRGLKTFDYRQITRDELLAKGYEVHVAAASNYRVRAKIPTKESFIKDLIYSKENEFWGAYDKVSGQLLAFAKNIVCDERCNISVLKAVPDAMHRYVYYGLLYEMAHYYLQERQLRYICDGARSATLHSNIQPFLMEKFLFRRAYCHLQITYRPWLRIMLTLLYPLRNHIPMRQVKALLFMEEMARQSKG